MRVPTTASRARLNFFAKASFTIATDCDVDVSARVNSRPVISGMPSVEKNRGPISVVLASRSASGPASKPRTVTFADASLPSSSASDDSATDVTPGTALSSSATCSNSTCARSSEYPFSAGDTLNVVRFEICMPRSMREMLTRLLANNPATTSRAQRQRDLRRHERRSQRAGGAGRRHASLRFRHRRHANARAVNRGQHAEQQCRQQRQREPEREQRQVGLELEMRCPPRSAASSGRCRASSARRTALQRLPRSREEHDSIMSCAMSCPRLAPSDNRTANSPARATPRASSRFAMLAHAMRMTMPVMLNSSTNTGTISPRFGCSPLAPSARRIFRERNSARCRSLRSAPFFSGSSAFFRIPLKSPLMEDCAAPATCPA